MTDPSLYQRIASFNVDGGPVQFTFIARLARENRWTPAYAKRVYDEDLKFAYLCMVAPHPCTPSDEVDQAWHLHMIYTESYWERFCGDVLPRELSHGPTKGGSAEGGKYRDLYQATKDAYQREFGAAPPPDIWPSEEVRFGTAPHFQRVNTRENLVIPKKALWVWGGAAVGTLCLAGCVQAGVAEGVVLPVSIPFIFLGLFLLVALIALARLAFRNSDNRRGDGSGCSTYTDSGGDSSSHHHHSHSHGHDGGHDGGHSGGGHDGGSGCSSSGCSSSGCSSALCSSGCGGGGCSS